MKYSILFGLAFIWCIFGCGCKSSHSNSKNYQNLEHYYLGQYVESVIDQVNYTKNNDRSGAKQKRVEANKHWKAYLQYRNHDQLADGLWYSE